MRILIFVVVLITFKLLDIPSSDVGGVLIVALIIAGAIAGVQDVREITKD